MDSQLFSNIRNTLSNNNIASGETGFNTERFLAGQANTIAKKQFKSIQDGVLTQIQGNIDANAIEIGGLGLHLGYRGYRAYKNYNKPRTGTQRPSNATEPRTGLEGALGNIDDEDIDDLFNDPDETAARDASRARGRGRALEAIERGTQRAQDESKAQQPQEPAKPEEEDEDEDEEFSFDFPTDQGVPAFGRDLTEPDKDVLPISGETNDESLQFRRQPKATPSLPAIAEEPDIESSLNTGFDPSEFASTRDPAARFIASFAGPKPPPIRIDQPAGGLESLPLGQGTSQDLGEGPPPVSKPEPQLDSSEFKPLPEPAELQGPKINPSQDTSQSPKQPDSKESTAGNDGKPNIPDEDDVGESGFGFGGFAGGAAVLGLGAAGIIEGGGSTKQKLEEGGALVGTLAGGALASRLFGSAAGSAVGGVASSVETLLGKGSATQKAESIGENTAILAGTEAAEAAVPGLGEVLMAGTAIGSLIADLVEKHKEKEKQAPQPTPQPTAPSIAFESAPTLDSTQFRSYIGGLQN